MSTEVYKTLVVGPRNVGKSSLVRRFLSDKFSGSYTATVGVAMGVGKFEFPEGRVVLSLVDLGGQESFRSLRNRFYQGAHHVILVFDVTSRKTFDTVPKWFQSLNDGIWISNEEKKSATLVANKIDLTSTRKITTDEALQMASIMSVDYFETSAKTGENVPELFLHAATSCRKQAGRL